jgi:DNA-binding helix-hairpin-helix protein with protein kinase domain
MTTFARLDTGEVLRERGPLGQGGQGRTWLSETQGNVMAVKTYFPQAATSRRRAAIERLIDVGSPDPVFVWPQVIVEEQGGHLFGYLMDYAGPPFVATEDFLARRVKPSFKTLTVLGWNLASAFLKLHASGQCYRDISTGNVRFDPQTGDIRIIDNDNVTIDGDPSAEVAGTPRFMAPEIARGEAFPSAETDRFSLAVLLFFLLMGGHPLDGLRETAIRCMNPVAMKQLYGFEPLYIFDPNDTSNRPDPAEHRNPIVFEPIYPDSIKKLFLTSFTRGLTYPNKRVEESIWCEAFDEAGDLIFSCQKCRSENFYKSETPSAGTAQTCWNCRSQLAIPARLRIRRRNGTSRLIALSLDKRVFGHHIGQPGDRDTAIGVVNAHPSDPKRLGLRNVTQMVWNLTLPDGALHDIPNGRSIPLVNGNKINFGAAMGEIEV